VIKHAALNPLGFLIGAWKVEMSHAQIPHPLDWVDTFEWLEDSFILWRWQGKDEVPASTSIIGRNENTSGNMYTMLYYDQRGIARVMDMSYEKHMWKYVRLNTDFSQRFEGTVSKDGIGIDGMGEISKNGGKTWIHDFSITYTKLSSDKWE
jgi:hypothetical protein